MDGAGNEGTDVAEVVLGRVRRGEREVDYRASVSRLLVHGLVVGGTGLGKSMWLASLVLQLLRERVGVVVLDPKGELYDLLVNVAVPALSVNHGHVRPERVLALDPFGDAPRGLDPLVASRAVEPAVQAWSIGTMLAGLFTDVGERMKSVALSLFSGVIALGGTLLDAQRVLADPHYARALGERLADPVLSSYFKEVLHSRTESTTSVSALRSRLDYLLATERLRRLLCAGETVTGREMLSAALTCVTTGRPPLGDVRMARFVASLIFMRLTQGIFERTERDRERPVVVVIDEFPEVVRVDTEPVERILSQARSRGVYIYAACQSVSQISEVSPGLVRSLRANVDMDLRFRPESSDISHLEGLLPLTGRQRDPALPDRLLSESEEKQALLATLARLPARFALLFDRRAGRSELLRTPTLPLQGLRDTALRLPEQVRRAFSGTSPAGQGAAQTKPLLIPPGEHAVTAATAPERPTRRAGRARGPEPAGYEQGTQVDRGADRGGPRGRRRRLVVP